MPTAKSSVAASRPVVKPAIAAEAAVWVARLHGPDRSSRMERECLEWQARSAEHREAFERCTDTWQDVARLTLGNAYAASSAAPAASATAGRTWLMARSRWLVAVGLVGMVVGTAVALQTWRDRGSFATGVGEQQLVVLEDGTRMSLNTNTRVHVDLDSTTRKVSVHSGEALFEVVKDPRRPFAVRVAGTEVLALGTVFSVRLTASGGRNGDALAVTLIEGQVSVGAAAGGKTDAVSPAKTLLMQPGERVRLTRTAGPPASIATLQVDRPRIDQAVAWKRGEVVFDDTPLADAVAEMNRYSRTTIALLNAQALTDRRISGVYRTGDSAGFARAVAALLGLALHEQPNRFELTSAS